MSFEARLALIVITLQMDASLSNPNSCGGQEPVGKVLLITMPLADPLLPNLAIEQLAQVARREGVACDVLYGTLNLGPSVPLSFIHSMVGPAIFAPAYHGLDEIEFFEEVAKEIALTLAAQRRTVDVDDFVLALLNYEYEARLCIQRCMTAIQDGVYDIVGFSVGFDSQKLASALLAKRLKRLAAPPLVVFGGTACDGPMAAATLEAFPDVDYVVSGEATETFGQIVRWLHSPTRNRRPPGITARRGRGDIDTDRAAEPSSIENVPDPDYSAFIEQRQESQYRDGGLTLFYETSRGCWWGRKNHCLFCGIKSVSDPWRTTEAQEALRRIETLYAQYTPDLLYCVDAILDVKHMRTLLPQLAERRRMRGTGPALFYEVKSNLKRCDIALLAQAGITRAQPGIENFSNHVLKSMRKGVGGLDQIAVLKWCTAYGIDLIYGYLAGIPQERPEDVREAVQVIPRLHHLQPPADTNLMGLHRFSPYEADAERYGIRNIEPFNLQRILFRRSDNVLARLCYELDYRPPWKDDVEHVAAHTELRSAIAIWREAYANGSCLVAREDGTGGVIVVRKQGRSPPKVYRLSQVSARLLRAMDDRIPIAKASRVAEVPEAEARVLIEELIAQGLAIRMEDDVLALAIPEIKAAADAEALGIDALRHRQWYSAGRTLNGED